MKLKSVWLALEQIVFQSIGFIVLYLAAKDLSPSNFTTFSVAYALSIFISSVVNAFNISILLDLPITEKSSQNKRLWASIFFGVFISLVAAVIQYTVMRFIFHESYNIIVTVTAYTTLSIVYDCIRKSYLAFRNTSLFLLTSFSLLSSLIIIYILNRMEVVDTYSFMLALATSLLPTVVYFCLRTRPDKVVNTRYTLRVIKTSISKQIWNALGIAVYNTYSQGIIIVSGSVMVPQESSKFRLLLTFMGASSLLFTVVESYFIPRSVIEATRSAENFNAYLKKYAGVLIAASASLSLLTPALMYTLYNRLYEKIYGNVDFAAYFVIPIYLILIAIQKWASLVLRVKNNNSYFLWTHVAAAATFLISAPIFMIHGLMGAFAVLIASMLVATAGLMLGTTKKRTGRELGGISVIENV